MRRPVTPVSMTFWPENNLWENSTNSKKRKKKKGVEVKSFKEVLKKSLLEKLSK